MRPYFGIAIPDAPGKFFYVWLDAPIGYLASLTAYFDSGKARANGEPRSYDDFVAADDVEQIHFIGKDIIYHHTLFWPAMLKFSGRKVPDTIYVHGWITVSGEKMSKSRGTGIDPLRYLELGMNPEWFRYYVAAKLNGRVEDIDFNPDDFMQRVNSDLIGKYVNIASRAASFLARGFDGRLAAARDPATGPSLAVALASSEDIAGHLEQREFGKALREVMRIADFANEHFDRMKPWELAKDPASRDAATRCLQRRAALLPGADDLPRAGAADDRRAGCTRTVRDGSGIQLERPARCALIASHRTST